MAFQEHLKDYENHLKDYDKIICIIKILFLMCILLTLSILNSTIIHF